MRVAIHQPNFIPWVGYFHKISLVETFVFLDDVQLERGKSFTQRVKILVEGEEKWLTIPVISKSDMMLIKEAKVEDSQVWKKKLLKSIELNYKKAMAFDEIFPIIEKTFRSGSQFLIDFNIPLIVDLAGYLDLKTGFVLSSEVSSGLLSGAEKIMSINKALGADVYVSGRGAGSMRYIDPDEYKRGGISLEWQEFSPKEYTQLKTDKFIPGLSIIDLVFNCGRNARAFI